MDFCDPFDRALAETGPPCIFLPDREGFLRFDADWSRDCWTRSEAPLAPGWRWVLLRDADTGFVQLILATAANLLVAHPRGQVRSFAELEDALAAVQAFGRPPLAEQPW